jgi:hypothetical protein
MPPQLGVVAFGGVLLPPCHGGIHVMENYGVKGYGRRDIYQLCRNIWRRMAGPKLQIFPWGSKCKHLSKKG